MPQSIDSKVISRIYGKGRGWSFAPKDFSDLGTRSSIDVALHRLLDKGTIRRVIRGVYDYPRKSKKLGRILSPDLDQVAHALARKFGWRIHPTGPAALRLLGLWTQVMARVAYLSDGPDRTYHIGGQDLVFQNAALKETGFAHRESSLLVQAIKTLGPDRATSDTVDKLRKAIDEGMKPKVLKDTQHVTGWIREVILQVCRKED